jgi:quinol monooxygenase YgiN
MIIVMGHAKMAAGEIDRLADALATQVAATLAEPGCLHYGFSRDVRDPDTMIISERWKDQDALTAHFTAPHMAVFNAAIGGAKVLDIRVVAYENGNERVLMGK